MKQSSEEILKEIDRASGELGKNLHELEGKVKDAVDWRKKFQEHPVAMTALAFVGGILLSSLPGTHASRR